MNKPLFAVAVYKNFVKNSQKVLTSESDGIILKTACK
jgi:hypothetical protein